MRVWVLEGRYPQSPVDSVVGIFTTGRKAIDYANARGVIVSTLAEWQIDGAEFGPTFVSVDMLLERDST